MVKSTPILQRNSGHDSALDGESAWKAENSDSVLAPVTKETTAHVTSSCSVLVQPLGGEAFLLSVSRLREAAICPDTGLQ